LATAAALLWLLLAPGMAAAAASWAAETSPTANALLDIACPDVNNCWSVGGTATASTIVHTANGSTASPTWSTQTSPTGATDQYNGVACAASGTCWAVGGLVSAKPLIGATTNGTTWTAQTPPGATTAALQGVSCPSTTTCFAVGGVVSGHPEIIETTNGGTTWTAKTAPASTANQLNGIDCPSTTVCIAVGGTAGTANIVTTVNGGTSWTAQTAPSGATVALNDITCTSTSDCFAAGNAVSSNGEIVATTNGGSTWTLQTDGVNQALADVACLTPTACTAVGAAGTIVATANGTSWSAQTSGTANQLNAIDFNSAAFGKAVGAAGTIRGFSGCGGSGLNFTPPGTLSWPSTALNGRDQTVGATLTLAPDDETGSGSGWNLTATSTTFKAGLNALPTTAATITAGVATAGTNNCTLPTNSVTYPLTVPAATTAPTAVKVYNAAVAGGAGPTNVALTTALEIPGNAKSGAYTSTWTITLASGP
jgi:hypothetical protein